MYTGITAMGGVNGGGLVFSLYFVVIVILGSCELEAFCKSFSTKNLVVKKVNFQTLF
jgi:hypothetical protein